MVGGFEGTVEGWLVGLGGTDGGVGGCGTVVFIGFRDGLGVVVGGDGGVGGVCVIFGEV